MLPSASLQAALPRSLSQALKSACTGSSPPPTAALSFCQSAAVGQPASPGRTRRGGVAAAAGRAGGDGESASRGSEATPFKRFLRRIDLSLLRGRRAGAPVL